MHAASLRGVHNRLSISAPGTVMLSTNSHSVKVANPSLTNGSDFTVASSCARRLRRGQNDTADSWLLSARCNEDSVGVLTLEPGHMLRHEGVEFFQRSDVVSVMTNINPVIAPSESSRTRVSSSQQSMSAFPSNTPPTDRQTGTTSARVQWQSSSERRSSCDQRVVPRVAVSCL